MGILPVMWTAKTKFIFFCWLSVYIIWISISVLKPLLYILAVSEYWYLYMNIHEFWYLYRNCLDTLPSNGWKWIKKGERKLGKVRFIYKTIICFETTANKFERLSHNLMENIKDELINRYKPSTVAATGDVLWEKVFLEILQNLQGNTCVRDSFLIKL